MSVNGNENKTRKTLLTPCRHVGLKRKSLSSSSTPDTSKRTVESTLPASVNSKLNTTPIQQETGDLICHQGKKLKFQSPTIDNVSNSIRDEDNEQDLSKQIDEIEKRISQKKEKLQELDYECKNVKQHNLISLTSLISKWRNGCQNALNDLLHEYQNRDKNISLSVLLNQFGIPHELVQYSETEMDFSN